MLHPNYKWLPPAIAAGGVLALSSILVLTSKTGQSATTNRGKNSTPNALTATTTTTEATSKTIEGVANTQTLSVETKSVTASITAYCEAIDKKLLPQQLDDMSSGYDTRARWERVAKHGPIGKVYQIADVWVEGGRVLFVNIDSTSPSGDWFRYDYYCFRRNGTLAKVLGNLNTFYADGGGVSVFRDLYYDVSGVEIASSTQVVDLQTQKPRPSATYKDTPLLIYKTAKELPFLKLIDVQI